MHTWSKKMFRYASTFAISLGHRTSQCSSQLRRHGFELSNTKGRASSHPQGSHRISNCEGGRILISSDRTPTAQTLCFTHTRGSARRPPDTQVTWCNEFTKLSATTRREFCRGPRTLRAVEHCSKLVIHLFGKKIHRTRKRRSRSIKVKDCAPGGHCRSQGLHSGVTRGGAARARSRQTFAVG